MNALVRPPHRPFVDLPVDHPRRLLTVDEIDTMQALGVIGDRRTFELIEGWPVLKAAMRGDPGVLTPTGSRLPIRRFTVQEVKAMDAAGVLGASAKCELIEGVLTPMQSKLNRHEVFKNGLAAHFIRALAPDAASVWVEPTLYIDQNSAPDPDLMVFPSGVSIEWLDPKVVMLVVEVADATLRYDLGVKAALYARAEVREYWVIDVRARITHVHREPNAGTWSVVEPTPFESPLTAFAFPDAPVVMSRFPGA